MIRRIMVKDWRLLWPMVALVAAVQIGLEWAVFSAGLFGEDPAAAVLLRPLTLAWFVGIAALAAAAVHQDPIPGVDQDWLVRPLDRTQLLLAKLAFVGLCVGVPMVVLNLWDALASGFTLVPSLEAVLAKAAFVFACFVVPVMALASVTRNMTELITLGAALVVTFALSLSVSAFFLGAGWCPTCNSGMSWMQHLVQHAGVLAGSAAVLGLQYYRRQSRASRMLVIAGAVCIVFAQLPWKAAFGIEQRITAGGFDTRAVAIGIGAAAPATPRAASGGASPSARQSAQALMNGHVDQAMQYMRRRRRSPAAPEMLDLPLRLSGTRADEVLLADRSEIRFFDGDGRLLYRGDNAGALATLLTPYPGSLQEAEEATHESLEIPGMAYRKLSPGPARMQMQQWLTLMKASSEYRLAAIGGELDAGDAGRCATITDRSAVYLRCKTISQAPFCYSAALHGADGRHNPEVLKCTPDYRRHLPAFMNVLDFYGADMPLRDRAGNTFEIEAADLAASYVLLRIYTERDHFTRSLDVRNPPLEAWRAATGQP